MKSPTGTPCRECPWRRESCPGWLGPHSAQEWQALAHSDAEIACHLTITDTDEDGEAVDHDELTACSGAAIYRSNVCKSPRGIDYKLPADRDLVFGMGEFMAHHGGHDLWQG